LDARETAYRRAIALSPDYAAAHQRYGLHLVWRGRVAEGLAEVRRAHELDPITEPVHGNLIEALLAAGEVDEAIAEYDRLRALSPNILWVRSLLGWAYLTLRYFDEIPYPVGQVVVRARSGHRDAALELFREHEHDMWPVYKGAALMALGDTSQAFALWADVAQRRDPEDRASVLWDIAMRYEPFVGVWHDPRFRSVMNIMGFDVIDGMVVPLGGAQEP
jgi:predicted Zn-dependent protease